MIQRNLNFLSLAAIHSVEIFIQVFRHVAGIRDDLKASCPLLCTLQTGKTAAYKHNFPHLQGRVIKLFIYLRADLTAQWLIIIIIIIN